ncbi:peptidoglycan-binding protein [Aetokthonos hydrillicola Thurmond2011]|jgi:peptidoglycan hydrolase-like protein with peptidoglycan-binding domain|uniref:Peptidoglycan-binding protein n=1 Tax=Aetokthonos hydrillicola Thurmond2011 TaxID=2712845 RepID=A0AAP5IDN1_9CYAN|nr:peptidoglycan-binding protein [Aetokthonos hydrillicola]MBW4587054.1 peptidoglycan-binding protein [Aetokthonos hydrillicola CCALA 1050]MDR9899696.1 peptidoglycan-binding protein [Aetokthonos hydrillicola Thurmond2011]
MRLSTSSILIVICLSCWGCDPSSAGTAKLASATPINTAQESILKPGSTGEEVKALQTKLKQLGYYDGVIDGLYGSDTSRSVSRFQQEKGLIADGIFGTTSRHMLEQMVNKKPLSSDTAPTPKTSRQQETQEPDLVWWLLVGVGVLGIFGALMYVMRRYREVKKVPRLAPSGFKTFNDTKAIPSPEELDSATALFSSEHVTSSPAAKVVEPETTTRLAKVNIVDELINDLDNPDPTQRRKAIWDLGQQGDSRAIQPLVELMINVDSQQRSLILAALAEIGTRTLKPMNHALAMSLQDESAQVRQNAIRDLTRVYDSMAQMSQMLSHAVQDPDAQVQATARYALSQMNRIRSLNTQEVRHEREQGAGISEQGSQRHAEVSSVEATGVSRGAEEQGSRN